MKEFSSPVLVKKETNICQKHSVNNGVLIFAFIMLQNDVNLISFPLEMKAKYKRLL